MAMRGSSTYCLYCTTHAILKGQLKEIEQMRVDIKQTSSTYVLTEDNEFKCQHDNIEIEPPCCTTPDSDTGYISCACGGMTNVYCPDCDNSDLTGDEVEFQIGNNWRLAR